MLVCTEIHFWHFTISHIGNRLKTFMPSRFNMTLRPFVSHYAHFVGTSKRNKPNKNYNKSFVIFKCLSLMIFIEFNLSHPLKLIWATKISLPSSGSVVGELQAGHAPVKISHKKDGHERWPHRFHVSWFPPPPAIPTMESLLLPPAGMGHPLRKPKSSTS